MVAEGANGALYLVGTTIPRWHLLNGYTLQSAILFKLLRSLVVQAFEGRLEAFAGKEVDAVLAYAGVFSAVPRLERFHANVIGIL